MGAKGPPRQPVHLGVNIRAVNTTANFEDIVGGWYPATAILTRSQGGLPYHESRSSSTREKPGCIPDYCASSHAKSLKQLRPGLTEQSRAGRRQRQRAPFALLIRFSSFTLFHAQENWDAPMQGKRPSALSNCAALCAPAQHDSEHRSHSEY